MKRLPPQAGEWIDRGKPLRFTFEGIGYEGYAGDTISSALLAAGVRVLGRSFKYHRPRSVLSLANHDVNALMQVSSCFSVPNVRADVTPLAEGLRATAVNTIGGVARDRARFLEWLAPFLPVGFYYKAFHKKSQFPFWERVFRRTTGLGTVDFSARRKGSPKRYAFCDVLVIGGGPAGLAAADAALRAGARVALVDENPRLGGSGLYNLGGADGERQAEETRRLAAIAAAGAVVYVSSYAAGYYADHWVPIVTPGHVVKMRARAVVVATGAYEQPAVFRNNDLPGVILASAAQRMLARYSIAPCKRAVVLAANDDGYRAARDLAAHGVEIAAVVDLRGANSRGAVPPGTLVLEGHGIHEALADSQGALRGVRVAPLARDGTLDGYQAREFECDGLLMSTGWAGAAPLLYQAGARMEFSAELQQFVPAACPPGVYAAGRVNGVHGFAQKLRDGAAAGRAAAAQSRKPGSVDGAAPSCRQERAQSGMPSHPYPIFAHPKGRNFVDFDEDLQLKDFFNAAQEGFDNIELMKRYSTVGMGPSQGKHSNMNAIRVLAKILGRTPGEVGSTTARPMFHPVPMSHLGGRGFMPERATPLEGRHAAASAVWMPAGQWQRPEYYAVENQTREAAIRAEVAAVRGAVGVIDVGTLGKIELFGRDAGAFFERIYTAKFAGMKVGSTRYGLMLDESGVVIDDGVIARLGEEHFYFTTTTTGSATVYRELTRLNAMWRMEVGIVNVTGHFAAINLAGPRSREVLAPLTALDLSEATFPYLGAREAQVAGLPARLLRVGFVGELGYEIHVPASGAAHLWDQLMKTGAAHGIRPFGVEAQRLLRLEKGHIIVSQDTDGVTNALELGMDWALKMDKPFFVGQRSLEAMGRLPRKQALVGFTLDEPDTGMPKECHLVIESDEPAGRITSIAHSPAVGRVIGLALVAPALSKVGSTLNIRIDGGRMVRATVSETPFYDPKNLRQKQPETA
ncbi:MAG: aminomethyltransferase [Betaproteobacteria bacterium]|nr:aminomethyltransferase [Betaproteobacteria bacterium]